MKKKAIALALSALLALGAAAALAACSGEVTADSVKQIATTQQTSGNVRITNYQAVIASKVDWGTLSDADRQKVIEYAFAQSLQEAAENNVNNYNIIGVSEAHEVLFMLDRNAEEVIIYEDGQEKSRVPAPLPASE